MEGSHLPPLTGKALLEPPPAPQRCHSLERARVGAGTLCQACRALAPSRQLPCQHKHGSLGGGSAGQAEPGAPSQDVGQEGPGPHRQNAGSGPSARQGKDLEKGNVSQDRCQEGWKLQEPGPARASARRALLHASADGSHGSTSADPIRSRGCPGAPGGGGSPGAVAGLAEGRALPAPGRAGCGAGPCFLH